ncbi:MAG: hypothetical protein K5931_05780 [Lachnospiraceae bacterium]|nr:hypothetical protein [Lachnospiraceae bacterium]
MSTGSSYNSKMLKANMAGGISALILLLFSLSFLTACSTNKDFNETTISINKKGNIESYIYESFDKGYYNVGELQSVLDDEIAAYNEKTGEKDRVKLKSLSVEDQVAKAVFIYKSYEDYSSFNNVDFFYGTIEEAKKAGYSISAAMKSIEDGSSISGEEALAMTDKMVIVISEPVLVESSSDIGYVTANVENLDKRHVRMSSDSSGRAYIILE